jgi:polar amino acid transport system permease protein
VSTSADESRTEAPARADEIRAVPVRHPGRWVATVVILVLVAMFVRAAIANPNLHWSVIRHYLTADVVLRGLWRTFELTVLAMAVGVVLGVVLAVMRLSPNPIVSGFAWVYIWFFRGTPVLVQLLFWFFLPALLPRVSFGVPFGPEFASVSTNTLITQFAAAILGLGLNEAAYMAEIVRAGIISVEHGQTEAAMALGMTRLQTMRAIVLPQAMRVIVPPTGNETISMLKTTSLVIVIALPELLTSVQIIYSRNFLQIPLLVVASLWYLLLTSVLTIGQYYVERRFARGSFRQLPPTPLQRLRRSLLPSHSVAARVT